MNKINNVLISLVFSLLFTTNAFAHSNPVACSGSGLNIGLFTDKNEAHVGDTVSFSVEVFNGLGVGPVVCDATGITATLNTPDGVAHPIALARTSLSNGQKDSYPDVVTYNIRAQDVQSGMVKATAKVTGTIHQNDTDSTGGGNQGVNIEITVETPPSSVSTPTPTITSTPSPSSTPTPTPPPSGGGGSSRPRSTPTVTPSPTVEVVLAPVVTPAPIFPKTGFGPEENIKFLILIGVIAALSVVGVIFKRDTV
jgi:hypothetical protein